MSPTLNPKLEQFAIANCSTKAEILRKAIVLYELTYRASLKDQRLGVFDEAESFFCIDGRTGELHQTCPDERLVTEIVGP